MVRPFVPAAVFVAVVASSALAQTSSYKVPRTPWGDPDLQGIWPSTEFANVPLERPAQLGTRNVLNDDEMVARALRERNRREGVERDGAGGPTGSPGHWVEWGKTQRQASLLVDPPDGRMPAMTAAATIRASRQPEGSSGRGPLNSPLDFTMWERCISRGVLGRRCRSSTAAASISLKVPVWLPSGTR